MIALTGCALLDYGRGGVHRARHRRLPHGGTALECRHRGARRWACCLPPRDTSFHADATIRAGGFQSGVAAGAVLEGRTLGVIGLGKIGARMARYGHALGMQVLAWSQNLTADKAQAAGARLVDKATLLSESRRVTLHVVLSERTRGMLSAQDLARMKPGAILVNTSRGPLVDEDALLERLRAGALFAALDVYGQEPLPAEHPLRTLPNTVLSPHLGYCTGEVYAQFYRESIDNVLNYIDGKPTRMLNPEAFKPGQR